MSTIIESYTIKGDLRRSYLNGAPDKITPGDAESTTTERTILQGDHKTPLPYRRISSRYVHAHGMFKNITYGYTDSGRLGIQMFNDFSSSLDVESVVSRSEDKALAKMISTLRNRDDVGHDFLVSLFESPELKTLFAQIDELLGNLKKFKFAKILRKAAPAVVAAEYYLLWTFAIAPLISAMNEIIQTLDKGMINAETTIKAVGQAEGSYSETVSVHEILSAITVRTSLQTTVRLEDLEKLLSHQFGLSTPGSAYYATLPLSFVFDWFINVGGYLNTLEYLSQSSGYKMGPIIKSQKINLQTRTQSIGVEQSVYGLIEYNCYGLYHFRKFERSILSELPKPHLPSWRPSLNGGKIVSIFALATSLLFGK